MREEYRNIMDCIARGSRAALVTTLPNGGAPMKTLYQEQNLRDIQAEDAADSEASLARTALNASEIRCVTLADGGLRFAEPFIPEPRLIILGGGHIALPLCDFAAKCGFRVIVADDRIAFANRERFPLAADVICDSFANTLKAVAPDRYSFVVVITRGHRHDADCLRDILQREVAYAGMIGSARRVRIVLDGLLEDGYTKDQIEKVHSPIGLKIGAVTPEEIAISILAEVILYKRTLEKQNWPELDREILEALAASQDTPFAIVTIVEAKGSVPRGAGAKMLVYPDGRTLGSIGGGCSESAVMQQAYEVIRIGKTCVQKVDLTGSAAEDEGMVCGGTMRVAIERFEG